MITKILSNSYNHSTLTAHVAAGDVAHNI